MSLLLQNPSHSIQLAKPLKEVESTQIQVTTWQFLLRFGEDFLVFGQISLISHCFAQIWLRSNGFCSNLTQIWWFLLKFSEDPVFLSHIQQKNTNRRQAKPSQASSLASTDSTVIQLSSIQLHQWFFCSQRWVFQLET